MNIFKVLPDGSFRKIMNDDDVSMIVLAAVEHDEVNKILKLISDGKIVVKIKSDDQGNPIFDVRVPDGAHFNWANGEDVQLMLDLIMMEIADAFDGMLGDPNNKVSIESAKVRIWAESANSNLYESEIMDAIEKISSGQMARELQKQQLGDDILDFDDEEYVYVEKDKDSDTTRTTTRSEAPAPHVEGEPPVAQPTCTGPSCRPETQRQRNSPERTT